MSNVIPAAAIDVVGNRTLNSLLDEAVAICGDKTWLIYEKRDGTALSLSYREFKDQVDSLAAGLAAHGIDRRDIVVLHMQNHPRFLVTWFALAALGAISVPVNVENTSTELAFILDQLGLLR